MSTIRLSAFGWVPPFAQGLVRDLRVRWALGEAGLDYEERLIGPADQSSPGYRAQQPFGQVPVYEEDGLSMFESGAIVMHIAERCEALMPNEPAARARTKTWMFAALNSIEPRLQNLGELDLFHAQKRWAEERRPAVLEAAQQRLAALAAWLEGRDYLEECFTAGDLLMATVLRIPRHTTLVADVPVLNAYLSRCEARPAFKTALAAQMAAFERNAPALS